MAVAREATRPTTSVPVWLPKTPSAVFHPLGLRQGKSFGTTRECPISGLWPPWACEYTSRLPSPLPSCTTASRRGPLVPMMQPANLG